MAVWQNQGEGHRKWTVEGRGKEKNVKNFQAVKF